MKTESNARGILRILSIIATLVLLPAFISYADEPPANLPIESRAALKAYAINAASTGYVQIWGQKLLSQNGDVTSFYAEGKNANDIIAQLSDPANTFHARTTDVSAPIYSYGGINSRDGDQLFWTSANDQIKLQADASGKMKIVGGKLNFKLAAQVPLKISGVTNAQIQYKGADGNQWTSDVAVQNGKLYFPSDYAGTDSTLVIGVSSPQGYSQIAYNLKTGDRNPGTQFDGTLASTIENHLTVSDKGLALGSALVAAGQMTPPADSQWDLIDSPSVTFTVTAAPGNQRYCTAAFKVKTTKSITPTQAFAQHITADGTAEEIAADSIAVATVGADKVITVSWRLNNDSDDEGGSQWTCYLVIPAYESQRPPQSPYYYGSTTTTTKG